MMRPFRRHGRVLVPRRSVARLNWQLGCVTVHLHLLSYFDGGIQLILLPAHQLFCPRFRRTVPCILSYGRFCSDSMDPLRSEP